MQHISKELVETPEHIIKSQIDKLLNNEKIVIYTDDLLDLPQEMQPQIEIQILHTEDGGYKIFAVFSAECEENKMLEKFALAMIKINRLLKMLSVSETVTVHSDLIGGMMGCRFILSYEEMCIVEEIPDEELVKKINYIISILLLTVNGMLV